MNDFEIALETIRILSKAHEEVFNELCEQMMKPYPRNWEKIILSINAIGILNSVRRHLFKIEEVTY